MLAIPVGKRCRNGVGTITEKNVEVEVAGVEMVVETAVVVAEVVESVALLVDRAQLAQLDKNCL